MRRGDSGRWWQIAVLAEVLAAGGLTAQAAPPSMPPAAGSATTLATTWEGVLDAGMQRLRFVLHLERDAAGVLHASADSPDQGALGLPMDLARLDKGVLHLRLTSVDAEYDAQLNERGDELVGTWRQRGTDFPLRLKAVAKTTPVRRPQLPVPPFPYKSEDVTFPSQAQGVTLAGTFTSPQDKGPFPAVVLISGSGPSDRDETLFDHKPFLVLADHLTRSRVPLLALVGDKNVQVVAQPHIAAIRQALDAAGHKDHTLTVLPGLNHLFQECRTGGVAEYASIEQTIAPTALDLISGWIVAHAASRPATGTEVR